MDSIRRFTADRREDFSFNFENMAKTNNSSLPVIGCASSSSFLGFLPLKLHRGRTSPRQLMIMIPAGLLFRPALQTLSEETQSVVMVT